jgi:general secretion pathway protein J
MNIASNLARRHKGFTLIELLIAIALMAVVSIMCWRGLDGVLRSRDWLIVQSDNLRGASLGFAQMEDDLRRSWMTRQMKLNTRTIGFATSDSANNQIAASMLRDGAQLAPGQVQQVSYRVRDGIFERGFSVWALPDPATAKLSDNFQSLTWQPLFEKVDSATWRVFVSGNGWVEAKNLTDNAAANQIITATNLVLGLEVNVKRTDGSVLTRTFGVRD